MIEQIKLKLSELPDEELVTYEYANTTYTVAEMKREILDLGEPHHERKDWCIAVESMWMPSAQDMITNYIENAADDMYEDWDERAADCVTEEATEKIQTILEEMFASVRWYWTFGKDVEIDIYPPVKSCVIEQEAGPWDHQDVPIYRYVDKK